MNGPAQSNRPTVLDRLERMTPEERKRFLDRLPPAQRDRLERRLKLYESLSPGERERLRERYQRFRTLPPERQQAARDLYRRFGELPPERRMALRRAVRNLSLLDEATRQRRMNSPQFRARFNPEDQSMIRSFLELNSDR